MLRMTVAFLVLVQAGLVLGDDDYTRVLRIRQVGVVLVGSETCAPCRLLEADLFGILRDASLLQRATIVCVTVEQEPALASRIGAEQGTPQLLVFRTIGNHRYGWRLLGYPGREKTVAWLQAVRRWGQTKR